MEIKEIRKADVVVLELSGRLDAVTSPELQLKGDTLIDQGNKKMVFDLANLDYISSLGLRVFLSLGKKAKNGGYIRFCNTKSVVKEVFEISGFSSLFGMYPDLDAALL